MLTTYALACAPDALKIWAGIYGTEAPPPPVVTVNGAAANPLPAASWQPIRDGQTGPQGKPLNHRAIINVPGLAPGTPYSVTVASGTQRDTLATSTLPRELPADGAAFNILLCSCYSQPQDEDSLLGATVSQIKVQPHLTLMMGDQIYGDQPLFEDLPEDPRGIARKLGGKYMTNWASSKLGVAGLGEVLARAPVACIADDHEYWNNYPLSQAQLPNTHTAQGRQDWMEAAKALYEDYQLDGTAGGVRRIDIDPLKILAVDMRSERDDVFENLMSPATEAAFKDWANDLHEAKKAKQPAFGVLCSGAALLVDAAGKGKRWITDAELPDYTQFARTIVPVLDELSRDGIPVVYLTGDVHWGRVARVVDVRSGRNMLHEIIASPSRLLGVPLKDTTDNLKAGFNDLFGKHDPWPRHGEAAALPPRLGLHFDLRSPHIINQKGDQVAILSFSRAGAGIKYKVTYYAISKDKAVAKSRACEEQFLLTY